MDFPRVSLDTSGIHFFSPDKKMRKTRRLSTSRVWVVINNQAPSWKVPDNFKELIVTENMGVWPTVPLDLSLINQQTSASCRNALHLTEAAPSTPSTHRLAHRFAMLSSPFRITLSEMIFANNISIVSRGG